MSGSDDNAILMDLDDLSFLRLMAKLPPDRRRIIDILLRRVVTVEATDGEGAALLLIDDISSILGQLETAH